MWFSDGAGVDARSGREHHKMHLARLIGNAGKLLVEPSNLDILTEQMAMQKFRIRGWKMSVTLSINHPICGVPDLDPDPQEHTILVCRQRIYGGGMSEKTTENKMVGNWLVATHDWNMMRDSGS